MLVKIYIKEDAAIKIAHALRYMHGCYYARHRVPCTRFSHVPPRWALQSNADEISYAYMGLTETSTDPTAFLNDGASLIWVRSSGNWLLLEGTTLTYSGRRHSLKEMINSFGLDQGLEEDEGGSCLGWDYIETKEQFWRPWETLDDHPNESSEPDISMLVDWVGNDSIIYDTIEPMIKLVDQDGDRMIFTWYRGAWSMRFVRQLLEAPMPNPIDEALTESESEFVEM